MIYISIGNHAITIKQQENIMKLKEQLITKDLLDRLFTVDVENGIFFNKVKTNTKIVIGKESGTRHPTGYTIIRIDGRNYSRHRLIYFYVNGVWPKNLDHIDGNKSNDSINNLRAVTRRENQQNRTRAKGYHFNNRLGKYQAQCWNIEGTKQIYLGLFDNQLDAEFAYLTYRVANSTIDLHVQKRRLDELTKKLKGEDLK
jgi:hypothetical protein